MKRQWILSAILFSGISAGCAHVEVTRVTNPDDTHASGVYFYRPAFYLSVSQDEKNVLHYDIVKLPDYGKEYQITFHQGWGTLDASVGLTDGWMLSSLGSKTDSKGPETITAVASLLTAAGIKITNVAPVTTGPVPVGFYRINFKPDGKFDLEPITFAIK